MVVVMCMMLPWLLLLLIKLEHVSGEFFGLVEQQTHTFKAYKMPKSFVFVQKLLVYSIEHKGLTHSLWPLHPHIGCSAGAC